MLAKNLFLLLFFFFFLPESLSVGGVFTPFPRLISCPFFLGIFGIIPKSNSLTFNKLKKASPALDLPWANAFQGHQKAA